MIKSTAAGQVFALAISALEPVSLYDLADRHKAPLGEGIARGMLKIVDGSVVTTELARKSYWKACFDGDRSRIRSSGKLP